MEFYSTIKNEFNEETYLGIASKPIRDNIAKIRSSSHDLNVETARYTSNSKNERSPIYNSLCRFCCHSDTTIATNLFEAENLPFFSTTIESERHISVECPAYHHVRLLLNDEVKSLLIRNDFKSLMENIEYAKEIGLFLLRSSEIRKNHIIRKT